MTTLPSTIVEFDIAKHSIKTLSFDKFQIDPDKSKIYWIHCDLNDQEFLNKIIKKLELSDDVIKLCEVEDSIPKLIDADDQLTLQIQCLTSTELSDKNPEVDFENLIMYLTPRFCFTAAVGELMPISEFVKGYHKAIRYAKTPCFIFFLILDNVINDYSKILFSLELISDQLDLRVRTEDKNLYNEVMDVKRQIMKVKRYCNAIREFLMRLSSRSISVISEQCRQSLYNLSNHSHMVIHEIDTIRDMLNGLLDQIDNTLMQQMNQTMKVLAAFAAIFLPLTLITGIYGMNFTWMPELQWKYGYFGVLALILICGLTLWFIFKKRKWF